MKEDDCNHRYVLGQIERDYQRAFHVSGPIWIHSLTIEKNSEAPMAEMYAMAILIGLTFGTRKLLS